MFDLTEKVALVTGARRGMGKSHAIALARQGAKVAVTDISQEECQAVVDEIKSAGGEAVAFKMDVSNKAEVGAVFDEVIKQFGRLDILVNNAGIYTDKPALEMSEEDWDKTININLKGEFLCAQRAAKEMAKNNWGRIINIASIASGGVGVGYAGGAHYTASKGGIIGMTETLAVEWAPLGINVNAIGPGAIDTPMISASQVPEEEMKEMLASIPLKRIGRPEEVSAAVVFLASEEASYITGATLYIDGGRLSQ
ncbi:MAG: SDR family NAD(P)-dependent oxidoreductase [Candidatus Azambacteria bacterium]|nr:SDR family NAD(P)-dependent oxidoreductase [Candidatus Azambacteria bacterium]